MFNGLPKADWLTFVGYVGEPYVEGMHGSSVLNSTSRIGSDPSGSAIWQLAFTLLLSP